MSCLTLDTSSERGRRVPACDTADRGGAEGCCHRAAEGVDNIWFRGHFYSMPCVAITACLVLVMLVSCIEPSYCPMRYCSTLLHTYSPKDFFFYMQATFVAHLIETRYRTPGCQDFELACNWHPSSHDISLRQYFTARYARIYTGISRNWLRFMCPATLVSFSLYPAHFLSSPPNLKKP